MCRSHSSPAWACAYARLPGNRGRSPCCAARSQKPAAGEGCRIYMAKSAWSFPGLSCSIMSKCHKKPHLCPEGPCP